MLHWLIWLPSLGWKLYSYTKSVVWFCKFILGFLLGTNRRDFYIALGVQTVTALLVPLLNALPVWLRRNEGNTHHTSHSEMDGTAHQSSSSSSTPPQVDGPHIRKRRIRADPDDTTQPRRPNQTQRGGSAAQSRHRRKIFLQNPWFWIAVYVGATTARSYADVSTNRGFALTEADKKLTICENKHGENSIACETPRDNRRIRREELGPFNVFCVALVQPGPIIDAFQMFYWYVPQLSPMELGSLFLLSSVSALLIAVTAFGGLWVVPLLHIAWQRVLEAISPNAREMDEPEQEEEEGEEEEMYEDANQEVH